MKELRKVALLILFVSALLLSSSVQGLKGNAATVSNADQGESMTMRRRGMREIETDDYDGPKPNVNPRSGALYTPPTPPSPSTPPPGRR